MNGDRGRYEAKARERERCQSASLLDYFRRRWGGVCVREDEDGRKESETEEGGSWRGVGGLR